MSSTSQDKEESPEELCLRLYLETYTFYQECISQLAAPRGYTILYGPPVVNAPIFFVGENPGDRGYEPLRWGDTNGYGDVPPPWELACKMQQIWPLEILKMSVGLNVNFFHSKNSGGWLDIAQQKTLRTRIDNFCRERATTLILALKPKIVLAYGKVSYDYLVDGREVVLNGPSRPLVWTGTLKSDPKIAVFGTPHLSGSWSRPNPEETGLIRDFFSRKMAPDTQSSPL